MKDWKIIKWVRRHKVLTGIVLVLLALYIVFNNWIYWGRVVDAETGKPIEGAVVVVIWNKGAPGISGGDSWVGDVKETLTDEKGKWMLHGPKGDSPMGMILSFIPSVSYTMSPTFIVYKPGYCPYPRNWSIEPCKATYVTDSFCDIIGCGESVGLPKLTKREDRSRALPGPVRTTIDRRKVEILKKQKEFIKFIDSERIYLGFEPYDFEFMRGDNNERQ